MQKAKRKQLETALSRIGAKVSLASDELRRAEQRVKAAEESLMEIQKEIEQIYLALGEPFSVVGEGE